MSALRSEKVAFILILAGIALFVGLARSLPSDQFLFRPTEDAGTRAKFPAGSEEKAGKEVFRLARQEAPQDDGGGSSSHAAKASRVVDPQALLTGRQRATLDRSLEALRQAAGTEATVVAFRDIGGGDHRAVAERLFARWDVGPEKRRNGLLVLLVGDAPHTAVLLKAGSGLEEKLPLAALQTTQQRDAASPASGRDWHARLLDRLQAITEYLAAGQTGEVAGIASTAMQP